MVAAKPGMRNFVDPIEGRHIPGEAGVWVLVVGDVVVFSLFFATFLYYRRQDVALFAASQARLDTLLACINTLFMLTSSWLVASGIRAARLRRERLVTPLFWLAFVCGAGFVLVKFIEYGSKIRAGISPGTNDFFMLYFAFTGIHLIHVLVGMAVLAFLARYARSGSLNAGKIVNLESGASFWHLVDLLWIVLFALFYVVR